jgi:hypothetical protein
MERRKRIDSATVPGAVNRNGQRVVRYLRDDASNRLAKVYEVTCTLCAFNYAAYGSDLWQRKCPSCQNGSEGLTMS